MKKRSLTDVKSYVAPGHFDMVALKLHGLEESGATYGLTSVNDLFFIFYSPYPFYFY